MGKSFQCFNSVPASALRMQIEAAAVIAKFETTIFKGTKKYFGKASFVSLCLGGRNYLHKMQQNH